MWIRRSRQQQPEQHQAKHRTDYYHLRPLTLKLSSPVMVKALSLHLQVRKASVNPAPALHGVLIGIAAKEENKEAEVILYLYYTLSFLMTFKFLPSLKRTIVMCLRATVMKTTK
jgi:hypothetical protein